MILEQINKPGDIKKIPEEQYEQLAAEIRQFLIEKVSQTGGHLASNLGVVELTMALHLVLNLPEDKIVWDVGHQSYVHKILSGRKDGFDALRQFHGLSGFPKHKESECDAFDTGHSSTSISAGLGIAQARDILNEKYSVVSVIGDGALTGGMAYEALNNAARIKKNFIIILNDNNMSISENVGGMSKYLNNMRSGERYNALKKAVVQSLQKIPFVGEGLITQISKAKNCIKQLFLSGMWFENMGITYFGPVDGHDLKAMVRILREASKIDHAVLIHVITKKGKGYQPAEENPSRFHGIDPFDIETGESKKKKTALTYTDVFSKELCLLAGNNKKIVAVTAAMPDGTGLSRFAKEYPNRFFDVGIAEEHAVTSAAGMAAGGLKPVVAVYSSFLQRGFDQILHDVCIQNLPVIFAVDRAGLVGSDGETHQGIFDLSYLSEIPGMTVFAPKNAWELEQALDFAVELDSPMAIRYPRGEACRDFEEFKAPIVYGKSEILYYDPQNQAQCETCHVAILAVGSMVKTAAVVRNNLMGHGIGCDLVNVRFVKPMDTDMLEKICKTNDLVVTLEENVLNGGYGETALGYIHMISPDTHVLNIALPDDYVEHGDVEILKRKLRIDQASITERVLECLAGLGEQKTLR